MRYRVLNVPLWLDEDEPKLLRRVAERLKVRPASLTGVTVIRKSLDARKKGHLRWLVNVEVELEGPVGSSLPDVVPAPPPEPMPARLRAPALPPVILGAGPAGLFCAHALLERGVRSIVVDRTAPSAPVITSPGWSTILSIEKDTAWEPVMPQYKFSYWELLNPE